MTFNVGNFDINPQSYTEARRKKIEKLFQDNRDELLADLASLVLSIRDIATKYGVQDRNIRRFADREGIDLADRQARRRTSGHQKRGRPVKTKPVVDDNPKAHLLRGLW